MNNKIDLLKIINKRKPMRKIKANIDNKSVEKKKNVKLMKKNRMIRRENKKLVEGMKTMRISLDLYNDMNRALKQKIRFFREYTDSQSVKDVNLNEGVIEIKINNGIKIKAKVEFIGMSRGFCYLCLEEEKHKVEFKCGHGVCTDCFFEYKSKYINGAMLSKRCFLCKVRIGGENFRIIE